MTHIQPDEIKIKILERRLEEVWVEGDRLQATTFIQDEELLQQLHRLEEATQKLEAIREYVSRASEVNTSLSDDLKEKGYIIASDELCHRILEVLGPSIDSDSKRIQYCIETCQYCDPEDSICKKHNQVIEPYQECIDTTQDKHIKRLT